MPIGVNAAGGIDAGYSARKLYEAMARKKGIEQAIELGKTTVGSIKSTAKRLYRKNKYNETGFVDRYGDEMSEEDAMNHIKKLIKQKK